MARTKAPEASKMDQAKQIYLKTYSSGVEKPRQEVIAQFQKKLGMEKSTAGTYHGLCKEFFATQQSEMDTKAIEAANAGRRAFSAYKLGRGTKADVVVEAHHFTTRKAAKEFNDTFQFSGVVSGIQPVNKSVVNG